MGKFQYYWKELQRRHVVKAGIAYLVFAWLVIQVLSILFPAFEASPENLRLAIIILGVGLPIWLIISWVYDFSADGIKRTEAVKFDEAVYKKKSIGLNRFIIGGLSIAVILLGVSSVWLSTKIEWNEDGQIAIAVLPFDNFSPDEENEWIGDGVTEQLLTQLAKLERFHVISRTSVMQYKGLNKTIPEIAKDLNVTHLLEGSVQVENGQVLVTAQLVDKEDKHLWAENYKGDEAAMFDLQINVAKSVSKAIFGKLTVEQEQKLESTKEIDPEARKNFVLANRIFDRMGWDGFVDAVKYYKKAVEIEPEWDEALAGLAFSLAFQDPDEAIIYAEKALKINPTCDQAAAAIGTVLEKQFRDAESIEFMENFINDNPDSPWTLNGLASKYNREWSNTLFNPDRALELSTRAVKSFPNSQIFLRRKIISLINLERLEEANSLIRKHESFFDQVALSSLRHKAVFKNAELESKKANNYERAIEIYKAAIDSFPEEKARYEHALSIAYNEYFNDNVLYLEYAKMAWENKEHLVQDYDVNQIYLAAYYGQAFLENNMLEEAENFIFSKEYSELYRERRNIEILDMIRFNYYCEIKDFKNAKRFLNEEIPYHNMVFHALQGHHDLALKYAQESGNDADFIEVFARTGKKDSLFYYLDGVKAGASWYNGELFMDPYRKDPRYIAFRNKHYLQDVSIE